MSGDPIEEEPMTAVLPPVDLRLLERNDLTVDDLVDLPEDLRYELIDGRLVLTPHALPVHQYLSMRVALAIEERCPDEFLVNVEQAILLGRGDELRPDVMLIRAEGSRSSPVLSPDAPLVVEVISKSSRFTDRENKLKRYAGAGIPFYWIIDPLAERITFTQFGLGSDGAYRQRMQTDEFVVVDEPWNITLDLPAWTRKRDSLREVGRPTG
jgi:Uma2 family endonuclease